MNLIGAHYQRPSLVVHSDIPRLVVPPHPLCSGGTAARSATEGLADSALPDPDCDHADTCLLREDHASPLGKDWIVLDKGSGSFKLLVAWQCIYEGHEVRGSCLTSSFVPI